MLEMELSDKKYLIALLKGAKYLNRFGVTFGILMSIFIIPILSDYRMFMS